MEGVPLEVCRAPQLGGTQCIFRHARAVGPRPPQPHFAHFFLRAKLAFLDASALGDAPLLCAEALFLGHRAVNRWVNALAVDGVEDLGIVAAGLDACVFALGRLRHSEFLHCLCCVASGLALQASYIFTDVLGIACP